jgi:hypothetical protein
VVAHFIGKLGTVAFLQAEYVERVVVHEIEDLAYCVVLAEVVADDTNHESWLRLFTNCSATSLGAVGGLLGLTAARFPASSQTHNL